MLFEILETRRLLTSDWQNPFNPLDVTDDNLVVPFDVLVSLNELNARTLVGPLGQLPDRAEHSEAPFYDVNGDGLFVPLDVLEVINALNNDSSPPTITARLANDTAPGGSTNADGLTFDGTIIGTVADDLTGVAELRVSVDDGAFVAVNLDRAAAPRTHQFTSDPGFASDGSDDGPHIVRLEATDSRFNTSLEVELTFVLDTIPPTTPTLDLTAAFDTEPIGDRQTLLTPVTLEGQTSADEQVLLVQTGATTISDDQGRFSFADVPLELGPNSFTVRATDAAGNTSDFTTQFTRGTLLLEEGDNFLVEAAADVELGQSEGTRTIRFDVLSTFDATDSTATIEDMLLVYLVDPSKPGETLLDRGTPGTSLFLLAGGQVEFPPGLVHFDGTTVSIDVTSLDDLTQGQLRFQLVNSDDDTGTQVQIANLRSVVDPEGVQGPRFPQNQDVMPAGGALDLAELNAATDTQLLVSNVRVGSPYTAEIRLRNNGAVIGRDVAVVFPGLPAGVTLQNASGTSLEGPYVNLHDAIPSGGLRANSISEPVQVTFDNPDNVRFALRPEIFANQNQPPSLSPVGPLSALPGDTLTVPVIARDSDGDPVTFSIRSSEPLPTGGLKADGTLVFRPTPDEVGSYTFDVFASDGAATARQTVTLEVLADPVTTTRISGKVLDIDQTPLVGMQVDIGAVQGLTQSDGSFTLDLGSGPLVSNTLKVRGELFSGPDAYPFIAEKLPLLLEHEVFPGVNNVIGRPIFLPPLDVANGTQVDPMQDTTVTTAAIPEATVFVAAGTLMNQQGTPFNGVLSITEVPVNLTPAALPESLLPDLVVTIQPGEMVFAAPAPLTLPNRAGFAPGASLDLWSINPVTGEFDNVGTGTVNGDGTAIETTSGGIRNSSWHFFAPPPPVPDVDPDSDDYNPDDACPDDCAAVSGFTSTVELHSGAVLESHDLVTYRSLGQTRGVRLVYDSLRADPRPIVHFGLQGIPALPDQFMVASLHFQRGAFRLQAPGFQGNGISASDTQLDISLPAPVELQPGENVWEVLAGSAFAGLQADLTGQPSGVYDYSLQYGVRRLAVRSGSSVPFSRPLDYSLFGTMNTNSGRIAHVDLTASPLGSGWGIAGLQQVVENPNGTALLIDGDGSELIFDPPETPGEPFQSPAEDFSVLEKLPDSTYRRALPDQTVYAFDSDGRMTSVTDRNGNATAYDYDTAGRLWRITDPVGLETIFAYDAGTGLLRSITDPAGRSTQFEHDAAGHLTRIIDPDPDDGGPLDSPTRTFDYDDAHHLTSEIDPRGFLEQTFYDFAGRATRAVRKDGTEVRIQPLQTVGLFPPERTLPYVQVTHCSAYNPLGNCEEFDTTNAITSTSIRSFRVPEIGPRPASPDAALRDGAGNVVSSRLNRAGQVVSRQDGAGPGATVNRDEVTNLITSLSDARGNVTELTHDARGNIVSVRDSLSDAGGEVIGLFADPLFPLPSLFVARSIADDFNGDGRTDLVTSHQDGLAITFGTQDGMFGPPTLLAIDSGFPLKADLNNDGHLDIAVLSGDVIHVLSNDGTGSFTQTQVVVDGVQSISNPVVGDVDDDGNVDLLGRANTGDIALVPGNGDGTFGAAIVVDSPVNMPFFAPAIAVGDVDDDGNPDIVAAGDEVVVLLGNGDRTFTALTPFPRFLNRTAESPVLADLDGDGFLDLITRGFATFGVGDGTFEDPVDLVFNDNSNFKLLDSPTVIDVNGDGMPDVVGHHRVSPGALPSILVYLGTGSRSLQAPLESILPGDSVSLQLADMDRDGQLDAITLNNSPDGVILRGNGDGTFVSPVNLTPPFLFFPPALDAALADMDDDFDLDIVTLRQSTDLASSDLTIFFNQGDGTFPGRADLNLGRLYFSIALGDLNADGKTDVLATLNSNAPHRMLVMLGDGAGGFDSSEFELTGIGTPRIEAIGDFTGDGIVDALLRAQQQNGSIIVLPGNGDGTFGTAIQTTVIPPSLGNPVTPTLLGTGDFNGDGHTDLAAVGFTRIVTVLLNNGDGTFAASSDFEIETNSVRSLRTNDVDGDGKDDIAVRVRVLNESGQVVDEIQVFPGLGDGTFGDAIRTTGAFAGALSINVKQLGLDDFDGDGRVDAITVNDRTGISVQLGNGDGTFGEPIGFGVAPVDSNSMLLLGDLNLDQKPDFVLSTNLGLFPRLNSPVRSTGLPGEQRFTYEPAFNQLTSITDELGRRTLFEIDPANGNRLAAIHVVGEPDTPGGESDDVIRHFTYTPQGLLDTATDALGRVTEFDYDAFGRLVRITFAAGSADEAARQFEYDAAGNLIAQIDENGNRTELQYDRLNRLVTAVAADPDGAGPLAAPTARFTYDAAGNQITETDPRDNTTQRQYDTMNRLIRTIRADGTENTFEYDAAGNLTVIRNPLGQETRAIYDRRNRKSEIIDANGASTRFGYDADNNLVSVGDASDNRTVFVYDARRRIVREIDPLGAIRQMEYDPANQLVSQTDRNGQVRQYAYDDLGRLTSESWIGANQVVEYTYDAVGNRISVVDQYSSLSFGYDNRNRVTSVDNTGTPNAPVVVLAYEYDAARNVLAVHETLDGLAAATTTYAYDALNRPTMLTQAGTSVSDKRVDLSYDPLGRFAAIDRFADLAGSDSVVSTSQTYDSLNRLTELRHHNGAADVAFFELTYDAGHRISQIADVDGMTTYEYDDVGQLLAADRPASGVPDETYTYDATGNRTASSLHGDSYVTGPGNRLLSDGTFDYVYDAEGNVVRRIEIATGKERAFQYDHRHRLVAVTDADAADNVIQRVEYTYDAINRRIAKKVQDNVVEVMTQFVYDRQHVILDFIDTDGEAGPAAAQLAKRYLHGPVVDQIFAEEEAAGQVLWHLTDHLGTVRDVVDSDGTVVDRLTYDSFGNLAEPASARLESRYRFTGREFDIETGLHYFRARYYDAATGRFVSQDPIGFDGGDVNLFRYVGNRATLFVDPFGTTPSFPGGNLATEPCPLAFNPIDEEQGICRDVSQLEFGPGNQLLDEGITPRSRPDARRCGALPDDPRGPSGQCIELPDNVEFAHLGRFVCDTQYERPPSITSEETIDVEGPWSDTFFVPFNNFICDTLDIPLRGCRNLTPGQVEILYGEVPGSYGGGVRG